MREILFHGKHKSTDEWIYWDAFGRITTASGKIFKFTVKRSGHESYYYHINQLLEKIDRTTIGQYTGLTDKDGRKIFEGDIVKGLLLFGLPVLGVASFKDGAFGLAWQRGDVDEFSAFTSMCNVEYEVIGNIHDNPELLGGDSL